MRGGRYLVLALVAAALSSSCVLAESEASPWASFTSATTSSGSTGGSSSAGSTPTPTVKKTTKPPTTEPPTEAPTTTPTPSETTEAPTTTPTPTNATVAVSNVTSNSTETSAKNKTTKIVKAAAVDEDSVATVTTLAETDAPTGTTKSANSQEGNTKSGDAGKSSLSGILTIVCVLAGAVIIGVISIIVVKKRRDDYDDDDEDDWDMHHLEVKTAVPTARANQQAYAPDQQRSTQNHMYRASDKMMMMDRRPSAPQNPRPMMVTPPSVAPQREPPTPTYPMEFRDTDQYDAPMQDYSTPQQYDMPQEYVTPQQYSVMPPQRDMRKFSDGLEFSMAAHVAAENFLARDVGENDIEGDDERESEMPFDDGVDIDAQTPSEVDVDEHTRRSSEQSLGMSNLTQHFNEQMFNMGDASQQPLDTDRLSVDDNENMALIEDSEVDLATSISSGMSATTEELETYYQSDRDTVKYMNAGIIPPHDQEQDATPSELEMPMHQQDEPDNMQPAISDCTMATGSSYCDRSSFGVFSVRDCSFASEQSGPADHRYSVESGFSVGNDVDVDDPVPNDSDNRFTELDEEFEV